MNEEFFECSVTFLGVWEPAFYTFSEFFKCSVTFLGVCLRTSLLYISCVVLSS
jgi:hypothetical protein